MADNLIVIHGGGPTAVINSSLYGVIAYAKTDSRVGKIYAAKNGTGGLLKEELIELTDVSDEKLELLKQTPGTAIGTSRDPLEKEDYEKMIAILYKYNIKYVLFNGGNGTMDTCGKLYEACKRLNKYIATSVRELCYDVESLPIHVVVVEASGRNAGWITAASALADKTGRYAPDLIYLPEIPFSEEKFLEDVKEKLKTKPGIVVVVSEGLSDKEGKPIVKPIFQVGRATYFGDISSHLANLVIKELGYKARGEKPGLLGRASITLQSEVDVEEAVLVGKEAAKAVISGESGKMIALSRNNCDGYNISTTAVDIKEVMMFEKKVPENFINETKNGVTEEFIKWCEPLVGSIGNEMVSFK